MRLSTSLSLIAKSILGVIQYPNPRVVSQAKHILNTPELWKGSDEEVESKIVRAFAKIGIIVEIRDEDTSGRLDPDNDALVMTISRYYLKNRNDSWSLNTLKNDFLRILKHELIHIEQFAHHDLGSKMVVQRAEKDQARLQEALNKRNPFELMFNPDLGIQSETLQKKHYWGNPYEQMAHAHEIIDTLRSHGYTDQQLLQLLRTQKIFDRNVWSFAPKSPIVFWSKAMERQPDEKALNRLRKYMYEYIVKGT